MLPYIVAHAHSNIFPQDAFDCIDLSDNDLRKLDNFPSMKRLKMLLVANNHISFIENGLATKTPNLHTLVLTNNKISELSVVDALSGT